MSDFTKVRPSHTRRSAFVYIRQSSPSQVENNRESTARQYALVEKACELGWAKDQVIVIDEDLGLSGSESAKRSGFARMTAEVALGHVGIVLGLEVSRLARNNADWYRLLDLCGITDTLIGDSDGIYHPSLFNDRLVLGLKGTMSEAELHILRARLDGLRSSPPGEASLTGRRNHAVVWQLVFAAVTAQLFVRPRLEPVVFDLVCKHCAFPE
jgi:DNA invertase Pin-like site-specific DNA recombinase